MKLSSVLLKFSEYCNPRKNITIIPQKFFTYLQHEGQNFHDFVTELKRIGSECEFESLYDSFIKDVIVCGTNDKSLREHLLGESELTQYLLVMLPKRLVSMPAKYFISLHRISKHLKSRSETPLRIKKCKFEKILTTVVNVWPMEKLNVIQKTNIRSAVHIIEKLSMNLNKWNWTTCWQIQVLPWYDKSSKKFWKFG